MSIVDKIKQVIINKAYIGKSEKSSLDKAPSKELIEGWKGKSLARRMSKVADFDLEQIKKGNINYDTKATIDFIKSLGIKNLSYLDVGCGLGYYVEVFDRLLKGIEINYVGVDYSKELIDIANKRFKHKNSRFLVANMQKLPFKNRSFDIVCCSGVIQYHPDYQKTISEAKRVARKYVLITRVTVSNEKQTLEKHKAYGSEMMSILFNEETLKKAFKKAGLKIQKEVLIRSISKDLSHKSYFMKVIR